jgi:hypothetical protein
MNLKCCPDGKSRASRLFVRVNIKTEHASPTVFIACAAVLFLHHELLYAMTAFRKSRTAPEFPLIIRMNSAEPATALQHITLRNSTSSENRNPDQLDGKKLLLLCSSALYAFT